MIRWVILTGEYPPQRGGVSDYTRLVAERLAAQGDRVTVYAPRHDLGPDLAPRGVRIRRLPGHFGLRGLRRLDHDLARNPPDRVLIQYVPHAFGWKAMNLPFAVWVAVSARRKAPVWLMFHEVAYPFVRHRLRRNVVAAVNRVMARFLVGSAARALVSIPGWVPLLMSLSPGSRPAEWLPVPSNVDTVSQPGEVAAARAHYAPDPRAPLVGHFGTFGPSITELLEPSVVGVMRSLPLAKVLFVGRGSDRYRRDLVAGYPELAGQLRATGELSSTAVTAHLRACDVMLQPYRDGVSSRRGSVMAALANRVPVVTNLGFLSESLWSESTGVVVTPSPDPVAIAAMCVHVLALSPSSRLAMGESAAELYFREFAVERTIATLLQGDPGVLNLGSLQPTFEGGMS